MFLATSVPAFSTTPPVKVLLPESVRLPAPSLVRRPLPERMPANSRLLAATVTVTALARAIAVETTCVPAVAVTVAVPVSDARRSEPPVPAARV